MRKIILSGLIGLLLGIGLSLYYIQNKKEKDSTSLPPTQLKETTEVEFEQHFPFINPLANYKEFHPLYYDEMSGFKVLVQSYIDSISKANKKYTISFYFRDLVTGTNLGYHEKMTFTPASLMKVPVLIALYKEIENNPAMVNRPVIFVKPTGDFYKNKDEYEFKESQSYTLGQLAKIMIKYSDNTATRMILDAIGEEKVDQVRIDLRLGETDPRNKKDILIGVQSYSSVFRTLYNTSYLNNKYSNEVLKILCESRYEHGIRKAIPSEIPVAQKFGIREEENKTTGKMQIQQLHHFGIVYRPQKNYLLGIMIKGDDEEVMKNIIYHISLMVDMEIISRINAIELENIGRDIR